MPRIQVTAKAGCIYDGVTRRVGARFDCDAEDARVLALLGKIVLADGEPASAAESGAGDDAAAPKSRRRYRRRDMTAES